MKTLTLILAFFVLALSADLPSRSQRIRQCIAAALQGDDKLVYADFEKMENNRPVSARGGWIGISQQPGESQAIQPNSKVCKEPTTRLSWFI